MKGKASSAGENIKDTAKKLSGYEQIEESAKEIKGMAATILSPAEQIRNAKKETFTQAMRRQSVDEAQLIQNYKNFSYIFYISLAFSLLSFILALYKLFLQSSIIAAIPLIAVMFLCLANAFKYSFRAFQIKHQKLCSVQEWWNRSSEWFPKI